jgi:cell division protein FtsQ
MAKKRKISIRKILQVSLTLVVTTCCIIAMVSASKIESGKMLKSVAIHIKNDKKYHFIEQNEIMDLAINNRNIDIAHTPLEKLDVYSMEKVIKANPWVASAQVYVDNERVLQMYVTQRVPVVRLFQKNSASYYLDTTMSIMPLSNNYIYYTTTVTNVPELGNDSMSWALRKDIITLVRAIQADSFWNAQVSQVIVDTGNTFELVPVLGDHRILFGDVSGMREKFSNLFVFYKNVLNRIGWDKYETLDLRFSGQVVASPSLPYKGPVDKAVVTMNWINSIIESEAKMDSKDSVRVTNTKPAAPVAVKAPVKPVVKPASAKAGAAHKPVVSAAAKKNLKKPVVIKKKTKPNDKSKDNKPVKKQKYIYPAKKDH